MKKNLKKKELEKVSGGYRAYIPTNPGVRYYRPFMEVKTERLKVYQTDKPAGTNSEQSEDTPEGLPLPQ